MKYLIPLFFSHAGVAQDNTPAEPVTDEVVITATRFEEHNPSVPMLQVIGKKEIEASGQRFLPDLLQLQSGISVRDNTGSPDKQVDMRGFGVTGDQNTVILIDGQRLTENELASANWSAIPISSVERIEIIRGGAAVLYGSGATGGVINVITKKPAPGARAAQVSAGLGNHATTDVRANGTIASDVLGMTLALNRYDSDNFRVNNEISQTGLNVGFDSLNAGPLVSVRFAAEEQDLRLPGARSRAQLITDRRGTATPDDFSRRDSKRVGLTGIVPVAGGEFRADLSYRNRDTSSFQIGTNVEAKSEAFAVSPRVRLPFHLGAVEYAFTAGVDWDRWDYQSNRVSTFSTTDLASTQENRAVYAQNTFSFPSLTTLILGGRAQKVEYEARDAASAQPYAAGSQSRNLQAYEVQVKQAFGESWVAYGKLGQSFRLATVDEVYAPFGGPSFDAIVTFLGPQKSHDREVGLQMKRRRVQGRWVAYHMNLTNEIHFDPVTFSNTNYPPSQRYGSEFDVAWRLSDRFVIPGNATYTRAKFRSGSVGGTDVSGKELPLVPRYKANIGLLWNAADTVSGGVSLNWVGEQRFDNDESNTFADKIPAFATVDTRLGARFGPCLLSGEIRNLLNEKYYTYGVRSLSSLNFNAYPAAERSFLVTGQCRF
ncbi:MAG: TonB-dependent receptor [Betaproteobacteria bacterium]|nr:TonB-dependent receptor [Betaproteobacteria bacterium]